MSYARKLDDVASLLEDLDGLTPNANSTGLPLELPLASIEEDPDQPRRVFDAASIEELAASIRERGVLQPIGVKPKGDGGLHRIVFGARRFRAARVAGLATIPAIIVQASASDPYDQMIENIQRDDLGAAEIAAFIASRLQSGETQTEIGRRLGKPKSYIAIYASVTQMTQELKAKLATSPIRAVYEVHQAWKRDPDAAAAFCTSHESFTRAQAEAFVVTLKQGSPSTDGSLSSPGTADSAPVSEVRSRRAYPDDKRVRAARSMALDREPALSLTTLLVEHGERCGRLLYDRMAISGDAYGLIDFGDAGKAEEVPLAELRLVALRMEAAAALPNDTGLDERLFHPEGA